MSIQKALIFATTLLAGCGTQTSWTPIDLGPNGNPYPYPNPYGYDLAGLPGPGPGPFYPNDLSTTNPNPNPTPDDGGVPNPTPGDGGTSHACTTYAMTTIASMRQATSGCYELDNVVSIAVTPTTTNSKSVSIHVQDAAGGDYSAMKIGCSSSSTAHPCAVLTAAKNVLVGRSVTVQGTFIKSSAAKGGFEGFYIDNITDNGAGTAPAVAPLAEADLERGATTASTSKPMAAYWFQIVTANIGDKLLMFDWSPPEFKRSGTTTTCPQWFGFGMIPSSAGATPGAACNGATQPAGQSTANAAEVLVSTDYYSGFKYSTDCACATMFSSPIPTAGQGVSGTVTAILDYDVAYGTTTGYNLIAPLTNANFNIQ
jgi:hypothetical protein